MPDAPAGDALKAARDHARQVAQACDLRYPEQCDICDAAFTALIAAARAEGAAEEKRAADFLHLRIEQGNRSLEESNRIADAAIELLGDCRRIVGVEKPERLTERLRELVEAERARSPSSGTEAQP